jgi:hypothetical protein
MADNPFDAFDDPKAQKANPFDAFDPPSATPTPSPGATSAPIGPSAPGGAGQGPQAAPADESWSSYLLRHMAAPGQTLHDVSVGLDTATRAATDWPTLGLADKLVSNLPRPQQPATGNDYSPTGDPQADTALAHQRLGAWNLPISLAGSAVTGGPELKAAGAIGEAAAPYVAKLPFTGEGKWLSGVLGSAAVGAPTAGVAAYGHEAGLTPDWSDIGQQAAIGGALSGGLATLGGVVSRGGQAAQQQPPMPSAADLQATMQGGFKKAGNVLYDNADIRQGATNAISEIMQQPARIARNGQGALTTLNKIGNNYALGPGAQSGEDLADFIRDLKMKNTGDNVDVAGRIGQKHMQNVLDNVTPITSGGQAPGVPGAGAAAVNEGNQAFGRMEDLERLGDQPTKAAIVKTQSNYQPGSPEYQASQNALNAMNPLVNWYAARHVAAPLVGAAVGGIQGFTNSAEGQDPYLNALWHAGEDALLFEGGRKLVAARPQGAFDALRYAIGTGQTKLVPNPPVRNALQTLLFNRGGGGNY